MTNISQSDMMSLSTSSLTYQIGRFTICPVNLNDESQKSKSTLTKKLSQETENLLNLKCESEELEAKLLIESKKMETKKLRESIGSQYQVTIKPSAENANLSTTQSRKRANDGSRTLTRNAKSFTGLSN